MRKKNSKLYDNITELLHIKNENNLRNYYYDKIKKVSINEQLLKNNRMLIKLKEGACK